jgi:hypothetical protein
MYIPIKKCYSLSLFPWILLVLALPLGKVCSALLFSDFVGEQPRCPSTDEWIKKM